MISTSDVERLLNGKASVHDSNGDKVGSLGQIYLDDQTGEPSWATVNTGLFGMSESFVSLEGASLRGDDLHVGYTKDQINDAPNIDEDNHLDPAEEDRLYEYYARQGSGYSDISRDAQQDNVKDVAHDGSDDESMTLSEERVEVGTESHETGRVRLRKYVVTENVTKTVPVQREEVRVERIPLDEDSRAGHIDDGDELEVTLHEEKAVINKDTVAVEEVRLSKETVTDQETVNTEVRKEQVDTDTDVDTDPGRSRI